MQLIDGTQPITLWRRQSNTTAEIPSALIRRFRHRLYSQVANDAVPSNDAHWYFPPLENSQRPCPGDEIRETDGTVWTILEVNLSPLVCIWQAVCETYSFAEPTETVEHLRRLEEAYLSVAQVPVRTGPMTTVIGSSLLHKLTFYVKAPIEVEPGDVLRRADNTLWKIVRIEKPMYRAQWVTVFTEQ